MNPTTRARRMLAYTVILGAVVVALLLFAPKADATCGYGRGGHKCETTTTTQQETTTTEQETTTTVQDTTTTTETETTTTAPSDTTTTSSPATTTTTGLVTVAWSASSECQTLTAEWGEGIASVDVWYNDPQYGLLGPDDGISGFSTPGTMDAFTATGAEFILVPVVESGFTATPDEIHLFTEVCDPTTTVGPTTTGPKVLPFTGISETMWLTLIFVALVSGILGFVLVMAGRDEE